jgi:uncharacterized damage-inducible protein DinB
MIERPQSGEYPGYAAAYISKVPDGPILEILEYLRDSTFNFFWTMSEQQAAYAYAEGKWTLKEVLGHMIDTERIFAFRALCFSRMDKGPFPGFDQDEYMRHSYFDTRTIKDLAAEFKAVRESNLFLYKTFTDEQSMLTGTANNNPASVRALVYMTAGHELHHMDIVKERYLK